MRQRAGEKRREDRDPLAGYGPLACLIKFFGALAFGLLVDVVVLAVWWFFARPKLDDSLYWITRALIAIPILWGILGIFYFEAMLDIAARVFEKFVDSFHWWWW